MERKTKPVMSKLRLPFFKRWKGQRANSSDSTDVSTDAFILFDRNLDIVGMNPIARSLFHLILGENVIGGDVLNGAPNVKHDNKNNGRHEKYLNAIRQGKPFFADSIVMHLGFFDINLRAEAFKVGKGFGIIFSGIDMLKKADETLNESQKGLATNVQSAPDCIFIFDLKGIILHGSRGGEKLTGYAWEEIKGKSFFKIPLFAPEYLPKAAQLLELSASGEPTGLDEFELIRKDGSRVSVEISTCPIGRGEEIEVIGIARDITERKRAEEELRKARDELGIRVEERTRELREANVALQTEIAEHKRAQEAVKAERQQFNDVLDTLPAYLVLLTPDYHVPFANRFFRERFGESHGKRCFEYLFGRTEPCEICETYKVLKDMKPLEWEWIGPDGRNYYVFDSPFIDTDGSTLIMEVGIDITERKMVEEELLKHRQRLEEMVTIRTGELSEANEDLRKEITGRKKAEEELRKSIQLLNDTGEMAKVGGWELDLATKEVSWTEEVARIHGVGPRYKISLEEAINFYAPESISVLEETLKKTSETGEPYDLESLFIPLGSKDKIWVRSLGRAIYSGGKMVKLAGTFQNIDKCKRAQEALREGEKKHAMLFESMVLGVVYQSADGAITSANPAAELILGLTIDQMQGRTSLDPRWRSIHEDGSDFPGETHPAMVALRTGQEVHNVIMGVFNPRNEDYTWININAVPQFRPGEDKPYQGYTIFENITERKRAEETLRESERKFRSVLEHSVDMIYQLNLKTATYDYVSPSSIKGLGYSPEELIALGFEKATSVIHPDDVEMVREHFNKMMKRTGTDDEEPPTIEYCVKHRKSGYRWMSDTSSVLYDDNNVPIAITGNVRDITKRKKAEEALKESEGGYRALVDTAGLAGEGIMIVERAEGNKAVIAFVNDALSGMLGYQREEMPGMPARDLFLPGDRIWLQDENRRRRKGEALPSHYAVVALRKDGSMLPIEISMGAMRYEGKSATVIYARDVTERKQAEEALRESEAQFRAIFDGAAIGVGLLDVNGQPFRINPTLREMLGYTIEELRSKALSEYMHPDDAKLDLRLFREMVRGKRDHYQVEKRFIRRDGQIVWGRVTLSAVRGLGGKLQFAIGMVEDITASKRALENLRKSEEHFRSLIENALDVIVIIKEDGSISFESPSVERALGYKPEELIGEDGFGFAHPDDIPEVMKVFNELMKNPGTAVSMQLRVRHKDGSWRVAEAVGRNLLDNPSVAGLVVNFRDVTEREQAHEELLLHTRRVEALHAIAQVVSQTLELEELLNAALEKLVEVMNADAGCVYLLDMVEKELVLRTSRGLSDETISRLATIKLNENNIQKILEWKGGSTALQKIFEATGLSITKEAKEKEQIQSFAVAPFAVRGQLSGLIAVGNRAYRKFSPGDIDLLRAVGNQIGIGTQNAMLYEEVRALIRETIDAQETERERICLEVHDGVAQTLVSAFQYLQALEATAPDDAQTKQLLAKTSAQVKLAIQESREVINSLQPATLSDLGLVSTLRQELKRLGQETGLKIDFKADAIRLPKDIETGLYRIIREAVFNARKHANTKQLRVKINSEDERVKVEVRDWGKGFDQAYLDRARKRGTGLFSIRKRAELMKGDCEIQSEPGQGTTVRVEIPVNAAERSSG